MKMFAVYSKNATICARKEGRVYKLFKISWTADGLAIHFPYLKGPSVISDAYIPAGETYVEEMSLVSSGKLASPGKMVKFMHHKQGESHFSGDKQIMTSVRRQTYPLTQDIPHLFTVQALGVEGFKELDLTTRRKSLKETDVDIGSDDDAYCGLKFVGHWFHTTKIHAPSGKSVFWTVSWQNQVYSQALAIRPPDGHTLHEFVLLIDCSTLDSATGSKSSISLIGGFDMHNDVSKDFKFLAFGCPVDDFDHLKNIMPSADYQSLAKSR